jgi:hypothetical protein
MAIIAAIAAAMQLTVTTMQIISIYATIASIAYQSIQASKMRAAAREAAEARKGFEMIVDGGVTSLPIVYGRAMVGGARVYHNTASNFIYAANAANKTFSTGANSTPAGSYDTVTHHEAVGGQDGYPAYDTTVTTYYDAVGTKKLDEDLNGTKNEFLFFQQALCQGPIHAVHDVVINSSQYLDDPGIGESYVSSYDWVFRNNAWAADQNPVAALRLSYFYNGGVDALLTKNFNERAESNFTGLAYLSAVVRLDRDNPQFDKVPDIQTLIEGKLVKAITYDAGTGTYGLAANASYSNNPSLCLLDYLLDNISGKGLSLSQIDLKSFYDASLICATTVQSGVNVGGKIYQTTDYTPAVGGQAQVGRNITTKDLPLYECNIIIDVTKPIRQNVESILFTMGDARLVWSQGTYKLNLQYPLTNAAINLATTLTDDNLAHDKQVSLNWPSSSERLNSCTVKFSNEANNFKDDSVSWPPKITQQLIRGIGSKRYSPMSGYDVVNSQGSPLPGGIFLNNYGVWSGGTYETSMTWKVIPKITGTYTLKFTADNSLTVTIAGGSTSHTTSHDNWQTVASTTRSLTANIEYVITITANDSGGARAAGATLTAPDNTMFWSSRNEAFSSFVNTAVTDTIYLAMLAEDNQVKLETEVYAEGVTDYYHALAKAEEMVRTSRSAIGVKFEYIVKDKYLEPGDIIKLDSTTLNIGASANFYVKVNDIKLQDGAICEVTGSRFDYTQLAWSVKPAQLVVSPNLYNFALAAPASLTFTPGSNVLTNSPGTLTWELSSGPSISGYILYFHKSGDLNSNGQPAFNEIGRATTYPFYVPDLGVSSGIFGVKAFTNTTTSALTTTDATLAVNLDTPMVPPNATNLVAILAGDFNQVVYLTWTIPATRTGGLSYFDHSLTKVYRAKAVVAPAVAVYNQIGTSFNNTYVDPSSEYGDLLYKVILVSSRDLESGFSNVATITLDKYNAVSSDSALVTVYKRSALASVTDNPGTVTYTFASKAITSPGTLANSWLKVLPSGSDPLWITSATAYSPDLTDEILSTEWSTPVVLTQLGKSGAQTHRAYILSASAVTIPSVIVGTTINGATPVGWSPVPVSLTGIQAQFQSDGITPQDDTATTWSLPYLSSFKVGSLQAITANVGALTMDNTGSIVGGKANYSSATAGFFLGYDSTGTAGYKFKVGDASSSLTWDGGTLYIGSTAANTVVSNASTALTNASTANNNATTAYNTAINANGSAIAAQASANTANSDIAIIVSDSYLSRDEKPAIVREMEAITGEYTDINTKAYALGASPTAYQTAYTALVNYLATLSPVYYSIGYDTPINATSFKNSFVNYYNARQALLNAIAAQAATLATWSGVSGVPSNVTNATTNRIFNQINAPTGTLYNGDIWYEQLNGATKATWVYNGSAWIQQIRASINATTSGTVWSDNAASAVIAAAPNNGGAAQPGDVVTIYGTGFAETRMLQPNSQGWVIFSQKINGNLLVSGSVVAGSIYTTSLAAIQSNLGDISAGSLTLGSNSPGFNVNTGAMTGQGILLNNQGQFAMGGQTSSIVSTGAAIYLNGPVVQTGNVATNAIITSKILSENITVLRTASQAAGFINLAAGSTPSYPHHIVSASIASTGFPIIINASCLYTLGGGSIRFALMYYSGGVYTLVDNLAFSIFPNVGFNVLTMPTKAFTFGNGTVTIGLYLQDNNGGAALPYQFAYSSGSITLLEVKR